VCVNSDRSRWQAESYIWQVALALSEFYYFIIYLFIYYVCKLQVAGGGGLCLASLPAGGVSAERVSHQVGA